ncbi:MAG: helix-turn-helix transcriptional regulator [Oscillospiraceae bacterium]|nr:helix-turn-helix transcriptional regulator [Oscillospiraceae bacterium]
MNFVPTVLKEKLQVNEIYTVHYFEFSKNYVFEGESHPFWEFVYVDKGEVDAVRDGEVIHLTKGQIIFHKPNEFHTLMADGVTAPNILIVSFNCESDAMSFFENKVSNINDQERRLLAQIIAESEMAFSTPLDDPWTIRLERREDAESDCEQFIKICLEWLLLSLMRSSSEKHPKAPTSMIKENSQNEVFDRIVRYMEANIDKQLQLCEICRDNLVGRSYLQKLFREKTGGGAIDYFNRLKINAAKRMIRESSGNFTDISMKLGYNSIHYFSRQFKSMTGMTLSEYASSVKILTGKNNNI